MAYTQNMIHRNFVNRNLAYRYLVCRCIALAAMLLVPAVAATTVYRSTDADGVVVFSDTPPPGSDTQVVPVETLVIDTPIASNDGLLQERLQAMRESTDRLANERRAREKHRAELRRITQKYASATPAPSSVDYSTPEQDSYIPYYVGRSPYNARPHYNGPVRHGQSPHSKRSGFNDYPASLIRKGYDPRVREVFEREQ